MFGKGNRIYSMITGKCPKCHEDHMYVNQNPYNILETMKMHEHCRHCGFKYKVEPNFFFGAMYVSYALSVLIGIATFAVSKLVFQANIANSFIAIFVVLGLLTPVITRLARNIYINLFVSYDESIASKT
ncbi:MAG: DUF983 domain-containing protein [Flavobacterium sp.]|uniref:DUF983 domain-containing protein n=1 Tax=Flavobacterium sp. TaxID=239 RepID=UPI001204FF75|nr:DUF983 domain-containing protein [Flavobacterium sp.]RZJ66845.1 MAG: DUF983 domain-containing protein [Flavobacterium sp.]